MPKSSSLKVIREKIKQGDERIEALVTGHAALWIVYWVLTSGNVAEITSTWDLVWWNPLDFYLTSTLLFQLFYSLYCDLFSDYIRHCSDTGLLLLTWDKTLRIWDFLESWPGVFQRLPLRQVVTSAQLRREAKVVIQERRSSHWRCYQARRDRHNHGEQHRTGTCWCQESLAVHIPTALSHSWALSRKTTDGFTLSLLFPASEVWSTHMTKRHHMPSAWVGSKTTNAFMKFRNTLSFLYHHHQ